MNFTQGRDEILSVLTAAWPVDLPLVFPDVPSGKPATETGLDKAWARAGVQHQTGGQASLAGETGARRWRQRGIVWIQIYAPISDGGTKADELAQIVVNAYRDKKNGEVWYRNARMNEVPNVRKSAFSQVNVFCDFEYDDVR